MGYADNHALDCYQMWDLVGHYVYVARDIIWLKHMCFPKSQANEPNTHKAIEVPVSAAEERESNVTAEKNLNEHEKENEHQTAAPKVAISNTTFMPSTNNENKTENDEWEEKTC